jgi:hypothetical protein
MEAEKAEKARQVAEALIVGKWNGDGWWSAKKIEFTKDGKMTRGELVLNYRVVDATHVYMETIFGNYETVKFKVSGNTLHFSIYTFTRAK